MEFKNLFKNGEVAETYASLLKNSIPGITEGVIKENIKFLEVLDEYNGIENTVSGLRLFLEQKGYKIYKIRYFLIHGQPLSELLKDEEKEGIKKSQYLFGIKYFVDAETHIKNIQTSLQNKKNPEELESYYILVENKKFFGTEISEGIKNFLSQFLANSLGNKT